METDGSAQRTPLYSAHVALGGRMVSFAGWELPVRYGEITDEHRCVRERVGLFDVSHMGEITAVGPEAVEAINALTCNDVRVLRPGRAQYNAITNHQGGLVDDIIVYMRGENRYLICVNAANTPKDFAWLTAQNRWNVKFENESSNYGQLALQGPAAYRMVESICPALRANPLKRFHFMEAEVAGIPVILARTGYTGEDGFEMFVASSDTPALWSALLDKGEPFGIMPIGLGARDSLRLEACYPLYGHELRDDVSPIESGLGWIVKLEKGDFIGRSVIQEHVEHGAPRSLVGFVVEDAGIAREGTPLSDAAGEQVGVVTSGSKTPTLGKAAGMALVRSDFAALGAWLFGEVRGRRLRCHVVKRPLYESPDLQSAKAR